MEKLSTYIREAFRRLLEDQEKIRAVGFLSRVVPTWERLLVRFSMGLALIESWNWYAAVTNRRVIFIKSKRWGKPNFHKTYSVPLSDVSSDRTGISVKSAYPGLPKYLLFIAPIFGRYGNNDLDKDDFIRALDQGTESEPKLDPTHEKICPRCAERIKRDALVCIHCGQEFNQTDILAAQRQVEERAQVARQVAQMEASQAQAEAELKRRRNRSWRLAIIGGLTVLVSSCITIILVIYSFSAEAADAARTSGVMTVIAPFICVVPVLAIGVWLLFLGIKRLRSLPKTEDKVTN
jgi:hypothetical protein